MSTWVRAESHTSQTTILVNLSNVVSIQYTPDRSDQEGRLVLYVAGDSLTYSGMTADRLYRAIEAELLAGAL
jgi:hypothetical protein